MWGYNKDFYFTWGAQVGLNRRVIALDWISRALFGHSLQQKGEEAESL